MEYNLTVEEVNFICIFAGESRNKGKRQIIR